MWLDIYDAISGIRMPGPRVVDNVGMRRDDLQRKTALACNDWILVDDGEQVRG